MFNWPKQVTRSAQILGSRGKDSTSAGEEQGHSQGGGKNLRLLHNLLQEIRLKIFQLEPHSSGDSSKPVVLRVWSLDLQHECHSRTCWKHKLSGPVQSKWTRNTGIVTSNLVLTSPPGDPSAHSSLRIPGRKGANRLVVHTSPRHWLEGSQNTPPCSISPLPHCQSFTWTQNSLPHKGTW